MKIQIECESQDEFEEKIEDLVKSLKGEAKMRRSIFPAQNTMQDNIDKKFKQMMEELKDEISTIIEE